MTEVSDRTVIAVGEPGCYAHYGHIDPEPVLQIVLDLWEEDPEYLEPARHSWMLVKDYDGNLTPYDPEKEAMYKEVLPGTPHAHPFTIIAVMGEWMQPLPHNTHEREAQVT